MRQANSSVKPNTKSQWSARFGDLEKFEEELRDEISQEKLRAFVTASVNVSDAEVEEEYKRRNSSFDVSYIALTAEKLAEKIQPSDEELRSYYESNKTDYRYLEPQRKVRYVFVDTEKAGSKIPIPDADLKKEFDALQPQFKEAGVKVQQIVLKVARKDLDPQVEQKAKDIIARLRDANGTQLSKRLRKLRREIPKTPRLHGTAVFWQSLSRRTKPNRTVFTIELSI